MSVKLLFIPYPSIHTCVLGTQTNRLIETVLLSTHNICFGLEIKKIGFQYALLSGGLLKPLKVSHFIARRCLLTWHPAGAVLASSLRYRRTLHHWHISH